MPTTRTERRYVSVRRLGRTHTSCPCPVSLSDQRDGHLAGRGRCRSYGRADASTAPCKTARTRFRTSAHRPHLLTLIQRPDRNESGREVQMSTLLLGQRHLLVPVVGAYKYAKLSLAAWAARDLDPTRKGPAEAVLTRVKAPADANTFRREGEHASVALDETLSEFITVYNRVRLTARPPPCPFPATTGFCRRHVELAIACGRASRSQASGSRPAAGSRRVPLNGCWAHTHDSVERDCIWSDSER